MNEPFWVWRAGQVALGIAVLAQCFGWMLMQGGAFDVLERRQRNRGLGIVFAVVAAVSLGAGVVALVATRRSATAPLRRAGPAVAVLLALLAGSLSAMFFFSS
jgi:hypothetical protein